MWVFHVNSNKNQSQELTPPKGIREHGPYLASIQTTIMQNSGSESQALFGPERCPLFMTSPQQGGEGLLLLSTVTLHCQSLSCHLLGASVFLPHLPNGMSNCSILNAEDTVPRRKDSAHERWEQGGGVPHQSLRRNDPYRPPPQAERCRSAS